MAVVAVILMAIIDKQFTANVLIGCILVFIATGAGNVINDYFDFEIDKINRPDRAIPSGRIKREHALYYSIILFIISIILSFTISAEIVAVVVICDILMILYAYDFKKRILIGNITVALLTAITFIYAGVIVSDVNLGFYLAVFAFIMTLSREIIKDTEDIIGDRQAGANTFPIKYGQKSAVIVAVILNIIACILTPFLYTTGVFDIDYLVVVVFADILFLISAKMALSDYSKENLHKVSSYMKIAMFISFISFMLGSWINIIPV